jgi:hypothetical protein
MVRQHASVRSLPNRVNGQAKISTGQRLTPQRSISNRRSRLLSCQRPMLLGPPALRIRDVRLLWVGIERIGVAIGAAARRRRQTLFIGVEAAITDRTVVIGALDADGIVPGQNRRD